MGASRVREEESAFYRTFKFKIIRGTLSNLLFLLSINEDVDGINFVINFDYPQNSEDYIHRIGRTGRSGATGTSYALFTKNNGKQAKDLIAVLTEANQVRISSQGTLQLLRIMWMSSFANVTRLSLYRK